MRRTTALAVLVGVFAFVSACGMKPEKHYQNMRTHLLARNFDAANEHLDKSRKKVYGEKERLLFYMDKGTVLNLAKRYKESNEFLEKAKSTAEDLWTESIGSNAAAWMTTDNALPYQGEDFEKVLIHFIAALNYLSMGDTSAARVEARQVTDKLELYNSKYAERKNAYRDDAFARWLSGKLAETEGGQQALNDAWIDYQRSIEVYEKEYGKRYHTALPRQVVADAKRVLEALGPDFAPELAELESKYPSVTYRKQSEVAAQGEVVFIHMAGEVPYKKDKFWSIYDNDPIYMDVHVKEGHGRVVIRGRRKLLFRVAFPEYVAKRPRIVRSQISVAGGGTANSEMMENITAIAIQNLNDHMARIKTKAITRAITKYIIAKVAQKGGKALAKKKGKVGAAGVGLMLAGAVFQVGSAIAEEADKRSWITLPAAISVARIYAPPGKQQLQVTLQSGNGAAVTKVTLPIDVQPGKTTFVAYRTFR